MKILAAIVVLSAAVAPGAATALPPAARQQSRASAGAFEKRWAEVDKSSVDALLELAEWADGKHLTIQARRCYRRVLRLEPDNSEANLAMGNVKVGDKWYPKAMAEEARAALEKRRSNGTDVEAPEPAAEEIVLDLPREETDRAVVEGTLKANRTKASRLVKQWAESAGVDEDEYSAGISQHVKLLVKLDQDRTDTLCQIGEYVFRRLNWITYGKTDRKWLDRVGGRALWYFAGGDAYGDLLSYLTETRTIRRKTAKSWMNLEPGIGGVVDHAPLAISVRKKVFTPASVVANTMGTHWLFHNAGRALAEINLKTGKPQGAGSRGRGRGHLMAWFLEGLGAWASIDAIGENRLWSVTKHLYKNIGRTKRGEDTDRIAMCYEIATGGVAKTKVKTFYQLTRTKLNQLTDLDVSMAWSMLDYLIRSRTKDWRALIKQCGSVPSFRVSFVRALGTRAERDAVKKLIKTKNDLELEKVYQVVCGRFEEAWKAWAKQQYQAEYDDPSKKPAADTPFQPIRGGEPASDEEPEGGGKKKKKRKKRRKRR